MILTTFIPIKEMAKVRKVPEGVLCSYCGAVATSWDHHKRPWSYDNFSQNERYLGYERKEVVPACKQCNSILNDSWLPGVPARAAYVHKRLLVKYETLLNSPDWELDEYKELGSSLAKTVRHLQKKKAFIRYRLSHLDKVSRWNLIPRTSALEEIEQLLDELSGRGIQEAERIRSLVYELLKFKIAEAGKNNLDKSEGLGTLPTNTSEERRVG